MMNNNCEAVWNACLEIIRDNTEELCYKTWFQPIKALELKNHVLTIQVPSIFFYEYLEEHFVSLLRMTIKKIIGEAAKLEYKVLVDSFSTQPTTTVFPSQRTFPEIHSQKVNEPISLNRDPINPLMIPGLNKIHFESQLNPNLTFDNYIEGDCNRLARSAGLAICDRPGGTSFNPLMIYGNSGLGKTHLITAIGNEIKSRYPDKLVIYVTCHNFVEQFLKACQDNKINSFVHFYQSMDVVVMDDVHDFVAKGKSQEIFFHIFNHLHQKGKQIILTADKAPKDLKGLEERLLSRFKWGLTADVQIPDYETRVKIIRMKMYKDGLELSDEVVEFLASKIETNARDLEGALITSVFHSTIKKEKVNLQMVSEVVKSYINHKPNEISIDQIKKVVCEYFQIPVDKIASRDRKREVVQARQITMYLAKNLTKTSLMGIGKHFDLHHSTVIHAVNQVKDLKDVDKNFKTDLTAIEKKLKMN